MDGARTPLGADRRGSRPRAAGCVDAEQRAYASIAPPDLLLVLRVDPDTAVARKRGRRPRGLRPAAVGRGVHRRLGRHRCRGAGRVPAGGRRAGGGSGRRLGEPVSGRRPGVSVELVGHPRLGQEPSRPEARRAAGRTRRRRRSAAGAARAHGADRHAGWPARPARAGRPLVTAPVRRHGSVRRRRPVAASPGPARLAGRVVQWLVPRTSRPGRRGGPAVSIVDEGQVQALWSIGLRGDVEPGARCPGRRAPPDPGRPARRRAACPPEVALARLAARASRHSRTQLLDEAERLAELRAGRCAARPSWSTGGRARWPEPVGDDSGRRRHDDAADHDPLLDRICAAAGRRRGPSPADAGRSGGEPARRSRRCTRCAGPAPSPRRRRTTRRCAVPSPVTSRASALPLVQPGRSTISWSTAARLGVRWSAVAAPTVGHDTGAQATVAVVLGREEMLRGSGGEHPGAVRGLAGEGHARRRRRHLVDLELHPGGRDRSRPGGRVTPVNRMATVCAAVPSWPRFRSPLVRLTAPVEMRSSASSAPAPTRTSSTGRAAARDRTR